LKNMHTNWDMFVRLAAVIMQSSHELVRRGTRPLDGGSKLCQSTNAKTALAELEQIFAGLGSVPLSVGLMWLRLQLAQGRRSAAAEAVRVSLQAAGFPVRRDRHAASSGDIRARRAGRPPANVEAGYTALLELLVLHALPVRGVDGPGGNEAWAILDGVESDRRLSGQTLGRFRAILGTRSHSGLDKSEGSGALHREVGGALHREVGGESVASIPSACRLPRTNASRVEPRHADVRGASTVVRRRTLPEANVPRTIGATMDGSARWGRGTWLWVWAGVVAAGRRIAVHASGMSTRLGVDLARRGENGLRLLATAALLTLLFLRARRMLLRAAGTMSRSLRHEVLGLFAASRP
jgi:hypothetical protein